ncbi:hypothetical protein [Pseudomonas sp. 30_B]|uniref:hypothetical protein n=1 Tax=Pseudomonas sp. 30_B TaxID=2813575 RepID=UPI001A9E085E|nr:hypothetical protein [Pseudomonas sp. 30_B]
MRLTLLITTSLASSLLYASNDSPVDTDHPYDLKKTCGFSLISDKKLLSGSDACTLLYEASPLSGMIFSESNTNINSGVIKGAKIPKGTTYPQRESYSDDARDFTQLIISKEKYKPQKASPGSIIRITRLKTTYIKEESNSERLEYISKTYECIDGIIKGKSKSIVISLCEPEPPRKTIPTTDWRLKLINSLKIE